MPFQFGSQILAFQANTSIHELIKDSILVWAWTNHPYSNRVVQVFQKVTQTTVLTQMHPNKNP
jgi:hypothetical protein